MRGRGVGHEICADEHDDEVLESNEGKNYDLSQNRNDHNINYKNSFKW